VVGGRAAKSAELEAVVRIGDCSGLLIAPNIVLTSAHCAQGPAAAVLRSGRSLPVEGCQRNPKYASGEARDDIGFCRLGARADAIAIPIDAPASGALVTGARVSMAGYGQSGPFSRDSGVLRIVDTTLGRASDDHFEVGTHDKTACRGDSGAPVLVQREGGLRVAGIVHGGSGAICASPAVITPIHADSGWLVENAGLVGDDIGPASHGEGGAAAPLLIAALAIVSLLVAGFWRSSRRRAQ
jgi:secreted trypsin-like serine protease